MKLWAVLILTLLLAACGSKGGGRSGDAGTPSPGPGPKPGPPPVLSWGDLNCQRQNKCDDPVLNLDRMSLHLFFAKDFTSAIDRSRGEEFSIYQCAVVLGAKWGMIFRQDGFDPGVGDFLLHVIDPVRCSPRGDLDPLLQTYFENTREYKNEIQNLGGRGA